MCAFLQKAYKIHIGIKYLKTTMRADDFFSHYTATWEPRGASDCYRGVCKAKKGSSKSHKVFFSSWELVHHMGWSLQACADMAFSWACMYRCQG